MFFLGNISIITKCCLSLLPETKKELTLEAKEYLCKVISALLEIGHCITPSLLIDFLMGKQTAYFEENKLDELETFGIAEESDNDSIWETIIQQAIADKYLSTDKQNKENVVTVTCAGKKFLKSPTSFKIETDDAEGDDEDSDNHLSVDSNMEQLLQEIETEHASKPIKTVSKKKSSLKIELIHAIDHKIDLDEFANSQGQDFLEILEELEAMLLNGVHLNIDYFINEILEDDQVEDIMESLEAHKGDIKQTLDDCEDSYSEDEVRMVYIKYLSQKQLK